MKKVISYFIKYPVAVNVIIFAFVILGFLGMSRMKSSFFPLQESKIINISVVYPGASPQEMEEGVVLKIENNLRGLVGIDRFTSSSSENSASIVIEAEQGYDIDVLLADVKNAVDKVPSFPAEMEPPVVAKQETLNRAISMVVTGDGVDLKTLKTAARKIETDLRSIEGISQVEINGFPREEIVISVKEDVLRAYNLSFTEIAQAVANANVLATGGSVKTAEEEYLIRVKNRSYYAKELEGVVVKALPNGSRIYLGDVAVLQDTWSETPDRSYFNGNPSVNIEVNTTNREDLVDAANKTLAYVEEYNKTQQNLRLEVTSNRSITIIQRTELLLKNGIQGVILVLFFLSLFLRPRLAFWVAFGLPISFLGMFMLVNYLDVTINVLSLFGMIIVIGILVDDGIVIAENIFHHYEQGKSRIKAAIDGTLEVIPAITSAILTTIIAFSTFFFLEGRIGEFFMEVTIVVMLTLGFSLLEAFVILPAHVAHSSVLTSKQKTYKFNVWGDRMMDAMRDRLYLPLLNWSLRYKSLAFAIAIGVLLITVGAMRGGIIRGTFFPSISSDRVAVTLTMPQGVNPAETDSIITEVEKAAWEVNREFTEKQTGNKQVVENIIKRVGPGTAKATLTMNLLPGEERDFSAPEIAGALFEKVGEIPGAESFIIDGGSSFGGKPVAVSLLGNNISELKAAKEEVKQYLKDNPRLRDVQDNDPKGIKEIRLTLNEKAYNLGLNLRSVVSQVRAAFNGMQVQRFQRGEDEIIVWVRYGLEGRSSLKDLEKMRIVTPTGARIPLQELATYKIERGEISINHLDGKREIQVNADLKNPKESATDIVSTLRNEVMPEIISKYPSVSALYEGQNREAAKTQNSAGAVLPIILLLIYIVIAFTFRSYSQPLLLLVMIPFAFIGVGWGHYIHDFPVNILSMLGIIALIGIVVNDGLVFISKFNGFLKDGMPFNEALIEAGKSRFRAIFLTSVTTIAGLSPLIFETSRQAQFLIPMAISIAYGIGVATILTLVMLPMLLALSNSIKCLFHKIWHNEWPKPEEVERAVKEIKSIEDGTED
ncbi:efflux RND transporter permease subunit [Luteibaculum oceani]|uniref:Efflux RND transporter permease subunit n=1 Tax=Luteibaculum oceani TaxID=1294296 RepID=A0A5C6UY07_9FLAO|nr:efflux RND transporter permease subunit [Luteibaculum oceani]TXC76936.1 efflux RND transporter permease subunit [Luteibaculum oceani]